MKKFIGILLAIILIGGAIAGYLMYKPYLDDKNGKNQENNEILFEVAEGEGYWTVADNLEEAGVIKSAKAFVNYMQEEYGSDFSYTAGTYKINSNMSYKVLGKALQTPFMKYITLTFPEGYRIVDMAKLISQNGLCTEKEFIDAQNHDDFDYDFIEGIDNTDMRGYRLEGYLFPATYKFKEGVSAHDMIDEMLKKTAEIFSDEELTKQIQSMAINLDEALTMASILEKEAGGSPDELANVSSVFWNRVRNPYEHGTPTLGSDPTVAYADLLEEKGFSRELWKGYSTYSTVGLPTGPICNPGLTAIKAAINPVKSDYYYFFTDHNEKFYYFETHEEFQQKWDELKAKGIAG